MAASTKPNKLDAITAELITRRLLGFVLFLDFNNSGIPSVQSFFVDGGNSTGNLFLGTSCGAISLTAVQNTGFGVQCLHNITSNANDNTGFGSSALKFMTNGSGNAAFGAKGLKP